MSLHQTSVSDEVVPATRHVSMLLDHSRNNRSVTQDRMCTVSWLLFKAHRVVLIVAMHPTRQSVTYVNFATSLAATSHQTVTLSSLLARSSHNGSIRALNAFLELITRVDSILRNTVIRHGHVPRTLRLQFGHIKHRKGLW